MKEVSVIIPTYNRGQILAKTIWSYLNDSSVFEVIVVIDGSTDNTWNIIRDISIKEPKLKVIRKENEGAPVARNYGILNCDFRTKYIFFGEDDAFIEKNSIYRLIQNLEINNADIIGGRIVPVRNVEPGLKCPQTRPVIMKPVNLNFMKANFKINSNSCVEVPFIHALFLAKKWVFENSRFDRNFFGNAYREETDFCIEASRKGAKIFYCPDVAVFHLEFPQGGQRRIGKLNYEYALLKNNWYFLNKHYHFLKNKYQVATPKICLQFFLIIRRIFLLIVSFIKWK